MVKAGALDGLSSLYEPFGENKATGEEEDGQETTHKKGTGDQATGDGEVPLTGPGDWSRPLYSTRWAIE